MRIVLIGQSAFACEVLDGLCREGFTAVAVYCPPDSGGRTEPLKEHASSIGIPVWQPATFKDAEIKSGFASHRADLAVLAYVTQIVPLDVIDAPRLGSICFHPSLLPRHRGGSAVNWTLIHGDQETGVTVFWPDAGIDTGPILLQKRVAIDENDSAGSLYYKKLFPVGVEAMLESVRLVAKGEAPRVAQEEQAATYEPLCRDKHAAISWERSAREVHNLIRGCDPRPGAYVEVDGRRLRLYGSSLASCEEDARAGTILEVSDGGMVVKAGKGAVRVRQLRPEGESKKEVSEVAEAVGLRVGNQL